LVDIYVDGQPFDSSDLTSGHTGNWIYSGGSVTFKDGGNLLSSVNLPPAVPIALRHY
jgi:hypothetical protein